MLYINNIALPDDQQSVIVDGVAAEKVYCNNELVWEYAPYPTCPGYTLYGDYFLSDTITPNVGWATAYAMTETVTVTKGSKTMTVTAKTLSKEELETLTAEQRAIDKWYWTSNSIFYSGYADRYAWYVDKYGNFNNSRTIKDKDNWGGARLGFKNPFIE